MKKRRSTRKRNPLAHVLYARRGKGPLMWFDGRKFTNNNKPKYFGTYTRAVAYAQNLYKKYDVLRTYKLYVGLPPRRNNPESIEEGLSTAADKWREFSGYSPGKVIRVRPRSGARTGLVFGELDQIGYVTRRDGVDGGKLVRYTHQFRQSSRPLLAVTSDGKQLHVVGGRYEFTDAGIEDR